MSEMNESIKIIGQWLGGFNRIRAMVGTKAFVYSNDENSLMFDFKMCPNANKVKIRYNEGIDLYSVVFMKVRGLNFKEVSSYDEVYGDMLKQLFEKETGLRLSL